MLFSIAVWDLLWGGKFPFQDTDTVKWTRGPNGYAADAKASGGSGSGVIPRDYRGEYYPPADYLRGQWTEIKGGATAGAYVCTRDHPGAANPPWVNGAYWSKFAPGTGSQWM